MPHLAVEPGISLRYRLMGTGARTLVLVHGWATSGAAWDPFLDAFDPAGCRVVVPDLRGGGGSDKPREGYGIERHANDLLALCDHAAARQVVLVAHSVGALYAQWLAAAAPERVSGLVLLCPMPAEGRPIPAEIKLLFRSAAEDSEARRTALQLGSEFLGDEAREMLTRAGATVTRAAVLAGIRDMEGASFGDLLGNVRAPTLVVGCDEAYAPVTMLQEQVVARIPKARLAVLPHAGHYPHVEQPHVVAALLQAFLAALA